MAQHRRVVIDLANSPSPEPQMIRHVRNVPDSRFITPDSNDSDDEVEFRWEMRKQRNDQASTNALRPNASNHPSTFRPVQKSHPVLPNDTKKVASQLPPTQPNTRVSKQPAPARLETVRPPASVPSAHRPPLPFVPTQASYDSPVSITNPLTKNFLAALSKSGRSTPPTLPPGAKPLVPSSRPHPSTSRPLPTPPNRVPQLHVPTPASAGTPMGSAVSQPLQPAQPTQPMRQSQPLSTSDSGNAIGRLAPPLSNTPSGAFSRDTLNNSAKSRDHRHESRNVPSPIVASSGNPVIEPRRAPSSVAAASSSAHAPSKLQPRKEPMAVHASQNSPNKHVPPSAKQHPPTLHKPMEAHIVEIDSSSEDEFVDAVDRSQSLSNAPPSYNSPRPEKRKVVEEVSDEEPVKRLRRTHSSAIQLEDPFQDDVVDSVEVNAPPAFTFPADISKIPPFSNNFGQPFTPKEDALIVHLKEVINIHWKEFEPFFPGRKWPSMQTRYSKVLSKRKTRPIAANFPAQLALRKDLLRTTRELRRTTHAQASPVDNSVSSQEDAAEADKPARCKRSLNSLVRHRELGSTLGREWPRKFQAGVRDFVYSSMGAQAYMDNASGDVSTIAWSPDGKFFAAGAVAVTDIQSIDYNKPRNLVVGSVATQKVKELPHHTIQHSLSDGRRRELFSTVQMVAFSPDSRYMYSAGIDQHLHKYRVDGSPSETTLVHRVEHPASVDFLSVSNSGLVATGCASPGPRSINVLEYDSDTLVDSVCFSGTTQTKKTPSALKWGLAHNHQHYLLAGFSREADVYYIEDDHRDKEGEVALWDINTKQRIETDAPNRNVFDLAWNPNPGGNSSIFAVASRPVSHVGHGIHSVVRLYSPQQTRAHHTMELDCPAWDINDVVYSPHDNNLIAVGSTEGRVYIWDVRFAKHGQSPLNTLKHGESLAVMPHEKKRWEVDTGIRFLSWGSERDRLYTGSSDGVVACWDPYRSDSEKRVRDVVHLNSAVMSGAFSPDYSQLLVGEDAARLNLLSVGNDGAKFDRRTTAKFSVEEAPLEEEPAPILWDCQNMLDSQALEVKSAGTMPFRQVVQGPNYPGPYRPDDDEAVELRNDAQKFQEKLLRSHRRRNKQTRKLDIQADPCGLDCGFIPLPDDYEPPEKWLSQRIPGSNLGLERERANIDCFRCGKLATVSPNAVAIECGQCGMAWKIGALGYEVIDHFKAGAIRRKVEEEGTDSLIDLCDSGDEWERFIREPSPESSDSDLDGGY
ncbi:unnamed protein product [Aureobasidium mustum]|uniref:WD40 repeat-like protein n=1 Tax=Aureobasidium mustum TaxID=2773714 RepID=A0A9N8JSX1_9PEZI|nr:unnamed protein product [Aureobasidium mustum]